METWIKRIYEEERKKRKGIPLEVKKIGTNYYLYKSTTVWDKTQKKRKKVSVYLAKITKQGTVEKTKRVSPVRSIFEYGNARLLITLAQEIYLWLKDNFPDDCNEILAMSIVKLIQHSPLKSIKSRWEKLYLSNEFDAALSPNTISEKLRRIGSDWASQKRFFEQLLIGSKILLFDMSSIFSYSENLQLAEKGHNTDHLYLKQINFVLFFSQDKRIPVYMKPIPGSVRDVKSLKAAINEVSLKDSTLVLDRGFASYSLADLFAEKRLKFVLPLRRNFKIIDYDLPLTKSFVYGKRGINWGKKKVEGKILYLFEDVKLRAEEETTFITLVAEGKRKRRDLSKEKKKLGKIAILSNIDDDGERVYLIYKQREEVETAFDTMKNEMENDKTYLSDDDAVRGYFFISFISLYLYYCLLEVLRKNGLTGKISVNDLLFELSKVYLIQHKDGQQRLSEIPKKAEELGRLFNSDLFPKALRS